MKKIIKIKNYETPIPGIDNCRYSAYPGGTARIKSSCNLMEKYPLSENFRNGNQPNRQRLFWIEKRRNAADFINFTGE